MLENIAFEAIGIDSVFEATVEDGFGPTLQTNSKEVASMCPFLDGIQRTWIAAADFAVTLFGDARSNPPTKRLATRVLSKSGRRTSDAPSTPLSSEQLTSDEHARAGHARDTYIHKYMYIYIYIYIYIYTYIH